MSKFSARKLLIPITVLALIVGGGWLGLGILFRYELTITQTSKGVEIHTLQLGEYFTPVKQLSILGENGGEVVRFEATNEKAFIHTVAVNPGLNEFGKQYPNNYSIKYIGGSSYNFQPGVTYTVKVVWPNKQSEAQFVLPKNT